MHNTLHLTPGQGFLTQAAQEIWTFFAAHSSAQQPVVVVPTAEQIKGVRAALVAQRGTAGDTAHAFLPRIVTLGHWLQDLPPSPQTPTVRSHTARLLEVQQTLKTQTWLRQALGVHSEGALWGLAQALLGVCDELAEVWLAGGTGQPMQSAADHERLLKQAVERAFARLQKNILSEETELVLTFWRILTSPQDPLPVRWQALQQLAVATQHPVVWCAPTAPNPMEAQFLKRLAAQAPVLEICSAWQQEAVPLAPAYQTLLQTWPECALPLGGAWRLPSQASAPLAALTIRGAGRFEEEAAAAASAVMDALNAGHQQLALVAQDRVVARRVRALLARHGVPVRDETGWKLSTTRAAAALMAWFDVCSGSLGQGPDVLVLLDFLKSPFVLSDVPHRSALVAQLESLIRQEHITRGWARLRSAAQQVSLPSSTVVQATATDVLPDLPPAPEAFDPAPSATETGALAVMLERLYLQARRWTQASATLAQWVALLEETLDDLGMRDLLAGDEAGRQLLEALAHLMPEAASAERLEESAALSRTRLTAAEWRALVSLTVETAVYREPLPRGEVRVTVLPLNGARMRQFDAVVMVGCDDAQLPSQTQDALFFSNTLRRELGLPDRTVRHAQQARDLAEVLLNNPQVVCTWQTRSSRGEAKRISPWLERLQGSAWPCVSETVAMPKQSAPAAPITRPQPSAAELVPNALSASAYNALRRCPYQFFVQKMLRLNALEEVSEDLEKRDVGQWLHEILFLYHTQIVQQALDSTGKLALLEQLSAERFSREFAQDGHALRYWKTWQRLQPAYVAWQESVEAEGWQWQAGEATRQQALPLADGTTVTLHGRLDRLDQGADGSWMVRDYKTQSIKRLKDKLKDVGEDCQLPFYALLEPNLSEASWVAIDGDKVEACGLPNLAELAQWLAQQIQADMTQLKQGAALPALGDAAACQYCEARGLCRKGMWHDAPAAVEAAV